MRKAKREWWKGAGKVRKNGSRVSWEPYSPHSFGEMTNNEMLVMHDGCSVQRRGDWLRWIEPAALVTKERETREAGRNVMGGVLEVSAPA